MYFDMQIKETKKTLKLRELLENKEAKYNVNKYNDYEDFSTYFLGVKPLHFLQGGKGNGKLKTTSFDPMQVAMGVHIEMEHSDDPRVSLHIALQHLFEKSNYYDILVKAGLADELNS